MDLKIYNLESNPKLWLESWQSLKKLSPKLSLWLPLLAASIGTRCNGTTAGLGYLEVIRHVLEKVLHGQQGCRIWTVWMIKVPHLRWRTFRYWAIEPLMLETHVRVLLGAWHNSSTDFNPKNNHNNSAPLHASFQSSWRYIHNANPKQKIMYVFVNQCTVWNHNKVKKSGIGQQIFKTFTSALLFDSLLLTS